MSTEAWGILALSGLAALIVGLVVVFAAGIRAVTKHPGEYDPARNAKRYTMPAFLGLVVAAVGLMAFFGGLAGFVVAALAT